MGLDFDEVILPLRNLQHLSTFGFPHNTRFYNVAKSAKIKWPPNLQRVILRGTLPFESIPPADYSWENFASQWPSTLRNVILDGFCSGQGMIVGMEVKTPQVLHSVRITDRHSNWYSKDMVSPFLGVKFLSLPANLAGTDYSPSQNRPPQAPRLERLEIRGAHRTAPHQFASSDLEKHVKAIPSLLQIRIDSSLMRGSFDSIMIPMTVLRCRAAKKSQQASPTAAKREDSGVIIVKDMIR
jgi:hypothetical protein